MSDDWAEYKVTLWLGSKWANATPEQMNLLFQETYSRDPNFELIGDIEVERVEPGQAGPANRPLLRHRGQWCERVNGQFIPTDYENDLCQHISYHLFLELNHYVERPLANADRHFGIGLETVNGNLRLPHLMVYSTRHWGHRGEYVTRARLVIEVLSVPGVEPSERLLEYMDAGIPEVWLVDPFEPRITQSLLESEGYVGVMHGPGETVVCREVRGFSLEVNDLPRIIE